MANSLGRADSIDLCIPEAVNEGNITHYVGQVRIGTVEWTIKRRYKEFSELHETLIEAGVDKSSLPQKRMLGNKDPSFIMRRRRELESYLQSVFSFLRHSLPQTFVEFLHLPLYDSHHILRAMASAHHDAVESGNESLVCEWTPLQLHVISQRLKSARPPEDTTDSRHDFVNVADLACRMTSLTLRGSTQYLGSSNIIPNHLTFDFLPFKNLNKLHLFNVNLRGGEEEEGGIGSLGMLRDTLTTLRANRCGLTNLADILLLLGNKSKISTDPPPPPPLIINSHQTSFRCWHRLRTLDCRDNQLQVMFSGDNPGIARCAPHIQTLLLGGNSINNVSSEVAELTELSVLELASNRLSDNLETNLHTRLGQITHLDLSNNKVRSLAPCAKLYSLINLNASANKICDLDNVFPINKLPYLNNLNLQGNHVTTVVDYRLKVFEAFGKRCSDLCLDNELPSQQEVDKVSVLMALRVAREGKSPTSLFGNLPRRV